MIETRAVIDTLGNVIHWHHLSKLLPELPNIPRLWDVIWRAHLQAEMQWSAPGSLLGLALTHSGSGSCSPSFEETKMFDVVENALGHSIRWWIINTDSFVICSRSDLAIETNHPELAWTPEQPPNTPPHMHHCAALQTTPISQRNGWMVFQMLGSFPSWVYQLRARSGLSPRFKAWSMNADGSNHELLLRSGSRETSSHDVAFAGTTPQEVARVARQRTSYSGLVRVKDFGTGEETIVDGQEQPYR